MKDRKEVPLPEGAKDVVEAITVKVYKRLSDRPFAGAKRADDPTEEMREQHNHGKNIIGTIRIQPCAKSCILRMYRVLARRWLSFAKTPVGVRISKIPQRRVTCYLDDFRRCTQLLRTTTRFLSRILHSLSPFLQLNG